MKDYVLLREIAAQLKKVAYEDAMLEAKFLQEHCGSHPEADVNRLIARRQSGEPLQYVLGEWEFYGLPMRVDARALIPRPETELLVETALGLLHGGERVLDLCCGSGCIGIALKKHCDITLVAADISKDALALTRENAALNGVDPQTVQSDLFDGVDGKFDLIVSNPPYLTQAEMEQRDESLRFEPALALDGGTDGLDFYRRIAATYRNYLKEGGTLLLEIGMTQAESVTALFDHAECRLDLACRPRMVIVKNE